MEQVNPREDADFEVCLKIEFFRGEGHTAHPLAARRPDKLYCVFNPRARHLPAYWPSFPWSCAVAGCGSTFVEICTLCVLALSLLRSSSWPHHVEFPTSSRAVQNLSVFIAKKPEAGHALNATASQILRRVSKRASTCKLQNATGFRVFPCHSVRIVAHPTTKILAAGLQSPT